MAREGEAGAHAAEREGRGRRDRRRRGNRGEPRPDRAPIEGVAGQEVADALTHPVAPQETKAADARFDAPAPVAPHEVVQSAATDFDSAPPIPSPFHAPVEAAAAVAPAPEHRPAPMDVKSQRQTEPQPAPRPAAAPRLIPELPPVSLALPPDSGLELVETKFKSPPVAEAEPATPSGPRRVRPPKAVIAEEPLQIVETQPTQPPAS
jgi:hypothetical protein